MLSITTEGKGQEPRMRSELRDNRAQLRDCGTVDEFAGQSPNMWDGTLGNYDLVSMGFGKAIPT